MALFRLIWAIALCGGFLANASPLPKQAPLFRSLASEKGVDWSLSAPSSQSLKGEEAKAFFQALLAGASKFHEADRKNLDEVKVLGESLQARGYSPLEKPLTGRVFSPAQQVSFYRKNDQNVSASENDPAHINVWLEFYYTQIYVKNGEKITPTTVVPSVVLHGSIFLRCEPKSKAQCPISGITFHDASIKWSELPSGRMGGDSSAGGAGGD